MFAKGREAPSVVSTRVLRTHRLNEVETFRLHGKIRTIDNEIQSNYSQISDEIDGVRRNLLRIKKLKNNLSISVERRKLLRARGVFVIPSIGLDEEGVILRRSDGKKVVIRGEECYDGEVIRRCIDINFNLSKRLSSDSNEEEEDNDSDTNGNSEEHEQQMTQSRGVFHYRIIVPPLHPGSRRNFKDFEDTEEHHNLELELPPSEDCISNLRASSFGRVRAQTTVQTRKEGKQRQRPKSQMNSYTNIQDIYLETADKQEHEHHIQGNDVEKSDNSLAEALDCLSTASPTEKQNLKINNKYLRPKTADVGTRNMSRQHHRCSPKHRSTVDHKDTAKDQRGDPFAKPDVKTSNTVTQQMSHSAGAKLKSELSSTPESGKLLKRRLSADDGVRIHVDAKVESQSKNNFGNMDQKAKPRMNESDNVIHRPDSSANTQRINGSTKSNTEESNCTLATQTPMQPSRRRSEVNFHDHGKANREIANSDNHSVKGHASRYSFRKRTDSFNSNANISSPSSHGTRGHRKSVISFSGSDRKHSTVNQDFINLNNARPDISLSQSYSTMQMTIGGKQVSLCVAKFSKDDVIDRARAKSAAQMADQRTRGYSSSKAKQAS